MPERLLFVISGILAGGIPGFRIELCCFLHPLTWPLVFFCGLFVLLLVRGHSHNDTQDVIMHVIPIAGCDPTSLCCVCFGLVVVVCFLFACFLVFLVWFFVWFLAGTARWTAYRSTTSTFVAFDKLTALHVNYNSSVCRD